MVRCKNCGLKFPSFYVINEVAFKTVAPVFSMAYQSTDHKTSGGVITPMGLFT